jgi:hypothetical protein
MNKFWIGLFVVVLIVGIIWLWLSPKVEIPKSISSATGVLVQERYQAEELVRRLRTRIDESSAEMDQARGLYAAAEGAFNSIVAQAQLAVTSGSSDIDTSLILSASQKAAWFKRYAKLVTTVDTSGAEVGVNLNLFDSLGNPVVGQQLTFIGIERRAMTDQNGHFFLRVPPGEYGVMMDRIEFKASIWPITVRPGEAAEFSLRIPVETTVAAEAPISFVGVEPTDAAEALISFINAAIEAEKATRDKLVELLETFKWRSFDTIEIE